MQLWLFLGLLTLVFGAIAWVRVSARRATPEETRRVLAERAAWIAVNRIWLGLAFGGGLIALTGIGMWAHAMLGETRDVDIARLETGELTTTEGFVRVRGHARGELSVCRETRGTTNCHTPFTSTASSATVAVVLSTNAPVDGEGTFAGMTMTDDVWGLDEIRARGVAISPHVFVVLSGETPEERRPIGLVIFACGAVVSAVGAFFLRRARRARS